MTPIRPCVVRLPDGRGCPEYTATSRCERHEAEFQAARWANGSTGRRGSRPGWTALTRRVKARAKQRCQDCRRSLEQIKAAGDRLECHHVNGRPTDDRMENLRALCTPCHRRADRKLGIKR